jgi:hypothetical protein
MRIWDVVILAAWLGAGVLWYVQPRFYNVRAHHKSWRRLSAGIILLSVGWSVVFWFSRLPSWWGFPPAIAISIVFLLPGWIVRLAVRVDRMRADPSRDIAQR